MTKPSVKALREILDGVVSAAITTRIDALAKAMLWYDDAIPYLIQKKIIGAENLKKMNTATKTRELGINTNHPEEKETAFKQTIGLYQTICKPLNPPDVNEYFKRYLEMKTKLEEEEARLTTKYQPVVDLLTEVFSSTGFKVTINPRAEKDRQFSGTDEVVYSRSAMKDVLQRLKIEGLMPALMQELMFFSRAMAVEPDGQGAFVYNPQKHVKAIKKLTEEFINFARKDSTRFKLLRYGQTYTPPVQNATTGNVVTNTPTVVKAAKPKTKSSGKIGEYDPNSPIGQIFARLKGGKAITHDELYKGISHSAPRTLLAWITIHGNKSGKWKVNKLDKNTVQLVMS